MGAQGQVEVDFGAHPGAVEKEVDVATAGVVATSLVEAWLFPDDTTDHNSDEHVAMMDSLRVQGRYLSDDNIRIRVVPVFPQHDHLRNPIKSQQPQTSAHGYTGAQRKLTYGKWTVGWVWN